jgi:hypothetical protein
VVLLSLTLFVTRIAANDPDDPFAPDYFAMLAELFD